jgi:hypothetical protein
MSAIYKVKDISSALKKKGFVENPSRDHIRYTLFNKGKKTGVYTFISHGLKEYGDSLIGSVKKQLHLQSKGELQDFINCPMTKEEYLNLLIERGLVR